MRETLRKANRMTKSEGEKHSQERELEREGGAEQGNEIEFILASTPCLPDLIAPATQNQPDTKT